MRAGHLPPPPLACATVANGYGEARRSLGEGGAGAPLWADGSARPVSFVAQFAARFAPLRWVFPESVPHYRYYDLGGDAFSTSDGSHPIGRSGFQSHRRLGNADERRQA